MLGVRSPRFASGTWELRTAVLKFVGLIALLAACHLAPLQAQTTQEARKEIIRGEEGFPIAATYYPALQIGKNTGCLAIRPVVILLHGEGGNRVVWDKPEYFTVEGKKYTFPGYLQANGYAVLTMDLRKHGESKIKGDEAFHANDWSTMVADLGHVKEFLFEEHQNKKLNMAKLAIVAPDKAAAVATNFAEFDWKQEPYEDSSVPENRTPRGQDVKALVLLSPEDAAGRLKTTNPLKFLSKPEMEFSLQVIVGDQDPKDKKQASRLFNIIGGNKKNVDRVELIPLEMRKEHGTDLLLIKGKESAVIALPIVKFLDKQVKDLNIPWQDRRSRIDR